MSSGDKAKLRSWPGPTESDILAEHGDTVYAAAITSCNGPYCGQTSRYGVRQRVVGRSCSGRA